MALSQTRPSCYCPILSTAECGYHESNRHASDRHDSESLVIVKHELLSSWTTRSGHVLAPPYPRKAASEIAGDLAVCDFTPNQIALSAPGRVGSDAWKGIQIRHQYWKTSCYPGLIVKRMSQTGQQRVMRGHRSEEDKASRPIGCPTRRLPNRGDGRAGSFVVGGCLKLDNKLCDTCLLRLGLLILEHRLALAQIGAWSRDSAVIQIASLHDRELRACPSCAWYA